MARKTVPGGGYQAVAYTVKKALEVGPLKLWKRMRSKNACKTCALGMGGVKGGMVNEAGHFPEVCKKSLQAQVADMKGALPIDFFDKHTVEEYGKFSSKQLEDAGRITYPVVLEPGATHYKPIDWEVALDRMADAMKACRSTPERAVVYASGRSSNEAGFILQSFARAYGTNHVMNCSYYCHQASGVALNMVFGSGTATVDLDDLSDADLVFVIGANPASNHPRLMTQLAALRARGGAVVVVNPLRESGLDTFHIPSQIKSYFFGSKIASTYLQPHAGGDTALFVGILKRIEEKGLVNRDFVSKHTLNFEKVLEHAKSCSWDDIVRLSGITKKEIDDVAELVVRAKSTIFSWAMGITHHAWGVDNVLAICNLALATANVGRQGAGLMPIRGHSNVQGIGSIGFSPKLKESITKKLEDVYKASFPTFTGHDTLSMIEACERGEIDFLFCLGGNLAASNPDLDWASAAMQKAGMTVYLSTKLNVGHFIGHGKTTIILPVLARDEEPQATTQESMFNYVRLSEGGEPNMKGLMRAESDVVCDLANRVLGQEPFNWLRLKSHDEVRKLIAEIIPGWSELSTINETKKEFIIPNRVFHTPEFPTETGKATAHVTPLPQYETDSLKMITIRSEGQFNSVVYEEHDVYRGIPHRNCVLVSENDANKLSLKDGQRVKVIGEAGSLDNIELVVGGIREGVVAMFYPESNYIIKARPDDRSRTPSFKFAPVKIEAM
jgi:molybdopterin-dependent oxidoreductase alpha subunit